MRKDNVYKAIMKSIEMQLTEIRTRPSYEALMALQDHFDVMEEGRIGDDTPRGGHSYTSFDAECNDRSELEPLLQWVLPCMEEYLGPVTESEKKEDESMALYDFYYGNMDFRLRLYFVEPKPAGEDDEYADYHYHYTELELSSWVD